MKKEKALKKIRRKIQKALPCPFCGTIPKFLAHCDEVHRIDGSFGHYVVREGCCTVMSTGKTDLFFCNNFKKPNYHLWWTLLSDMIDSWNKRI